MQIHTVINVMVFPKSGIRRLVHGDFTCDDDRVGKRAIERIEPLRVVNFIGPDLSFVKKIALRAISSFAKIAAAQALV